MNLQKGNCYMKNDSVKWNKIASKISAVYLAGMLSIFLVYCGTNGYVSILRSKWILYLLLSISYLGILLLSRLELTLVGALPFPRPISFWKALNHPQKTMCLLWFCSAISTILSTHPKLSLWGSERREGLITITLYIGCCLAISLYGKLRPWMLWLFAITMSLNCILALIQLAGYNPFHLYPQGLNYYDKYELYAGEFLGTIGNVDILSAVLCIAIPLFWIALIRGSNPRRWLLCIPLGLCVIVLFRAFVSGGIVAVCSSILLTIPVLQTTHKARKTAWITVFLLCIIGIVAIYLLGYRTSGFIYEASELLHGHWDDSFGSGRLYIWRTAAELIPQHPLFGCGPDTLGLQIDAAFERINKSVGAVIHSQVDNAHNEYLNMLVERGAVTLMIYLALLVQCAYHWVRNAAKQPAAALCGGAVLAYCIQAFFGLSSPASAIYFWLALGGLIGTTAVHSTAHQMKKEERKNAKY